MEYFVRKVKRLGFFQINKVAQEIKLSFHLLALLPLLDFVQELKLIYSIHSSPLALLLSLLSDQVGQLTTQPWGVFLT